MTSSQPASRACSSRTVSTCDPNAITTGRGVPSCSSNDRGSMSAHPRSRKIARGFTAANRVLIVSAFPTVSIRNPSDAAVLVILLVNIKSRVSSNPSIAGISESESVNSLPLNAEYSPLFASKLNRTAMEVNVLPPRVLLFPDASFHRCNGDWCTAAIKLLDNSDIRNYRAVTHHADVR